jgi:hypothetical protein
MSQEAQGVLWTTMMLSHACWGNCLRHALNKLPKKLAATTSPVHKGLRSQFHFWAISSLCNRSKKLRGKDADANEQQLACFSLS